MNKFVVSFFGLLLNCYLINVHASLEDSLAKDGLTQDCNTVGTLLNKGRVNDLQKAFLLNTEFYCYAKKEIKNNKKTVLEKEKEYKKKIIKLVSDAMKSDDNYSQNLLKSIRYHLSLPVDINELIIKKYTKKTLEFPPFDETGEHPFKPEVFVFNQYKDISGAYFAEGMEKEGERVIQELSELPHQSKGKIQDLRNEMKGIYQSWKSKQDAKDKKDGVDEKIKQAESASPKKPDPVVSTVKQQPVVKAEEPNKKDKVLQEENNNQAIIIGIAIGVLVLIGFMLARRSKK